MSSSNIVLRTVQQMIFLQINVIKFNKVLLFNFEDGARSSHALKRTESYIFKGIIWPILCFRRMWYYIFYLPLHSALCPGRQNFRDYIYGAPWLSFSVWPVKGHGRSLKGKRNKGQYLFPCFPPRHGSAILCYFTKGHRFVMWTPTVRTLSSVWEGASVPGCYR